MCGCKKNKRMRMWSLTTTISMLFIWVCCAAIDESQCSSEATIAPLLEKILDRLGGLEAEMKEFKMEMKMEIKEMKMEMKEFKMEMKMEMKEFMMEMKMEIKEMKMEMKEMQMEIQRGFSDLHNFGSSRVKVAAGATEPIHFEYPYSDCPGVGTRHLVYNSGFFAQIFTPHFFCTKPPSHETIIACEQADIGLLAMCPNGHINAINITEEVSVILGDEVIAYGLGSIAKMWKGYISNVVTEDSCASHRHWNGTSCNQPGDLMVQGMQDESMSGGPVINGCGYVGMAVNVVKNELASFASVAAAANIRKCMTAHQSVLRSDCRNKIVSIPTYPWGLCSRN
jgi:hypothetical protein